MKITTTIGSGFVEVEMIGAPIKVSSWLIASDDSGKFYLYNRSGCTFGESHDELDQAIRMAKKTLKSDLADYKIENPS